MLEKSRIVEMDYLRAGAAIAVVLFHFAFKGPSEGWIEGGDFGQFSSVAGYGYLGVNLFFIISGFVIAMSAQSATWQSFARSRFLRLMPAMWVCASVTAIGILVIGALTGANEAPGTFVHRALLKNTWGNYFASLTLVPSWFGFSGIDSAYWSLRIEVQFYLAVCMLLLFEKRNWTTGLLIIWLMASTLNLVRPIWRLDFILCLTWAPYFVVGIVLYNWRTNGASKLQTIGLAWATFLCLGYGYKSAVKDGYENPLVSCSLVLTLIALFAWAILRSKGIADKRGTRLDKFGLLLGTISYPLYLVHQELGYALFNALFKALAHSNFIVQTCVFLFVFVLVVALSWMINRWPEQTLTKHLRKFPLLRNSILKQ
jgi:peptidoglycan/LPS O-acetylase OafA/YrhL